MTLDVLSTGSDFLFPSASPVPKLVADPTPAQNSIDWASEEYFSTVLDKILKPENIRTLNNFAEKPTSTVTKKSESCWHDPFLLVLDPPRVDIDIRAALKGALSAIDNEMQDTAKSKLVADDSWREDTVEALEEDKPIVAPSQAIFYDELLPSPCYSTISENPIVESSFVFSPMASVIEESMMYPVPYNKPLPALQEVPDVMEAPKQHNTKSKIVSMMKKMKQSVSKPFVKNEAPNPFKRLFSKRW
ncbi:hypothetical protein BGW37DRAFT_473490 [Umbelopsis sp. PMI_123]|nr:hypothetical protein BGW37DRAFT_473490 [Umbelopsis sp. PMI_123]